MSLAINEFADVAAKAATDVAAEGANTARRLIDEGKTMAKSAKSQVDSGLAFVEDEIAAHPARVLAFACGLGLVIGLLLMRRA